MTNLESIILFTETTPFRFIYTGVMVFTLGCALLMIRSCGISDALDCEEWKCLILAYVRLCAWIVGILMMGYGIYLLVVT